VEFITQVEIEEDLSIADIFPFSPSSLSLISKSSATTSAASLFYVTRPNIFDLCSKNNTELSLYRSCCCRIQYGLPFISTKLKLYFFMTKKKEIIIIILTYACGRDFVASTGEREPALCQYYVMSLLLFVAAVVIEFGSLSFVTVCGFDHLPSAFRRLVYLTPFATEKEKFFSLV
jgi:hypothetical protein